MNKNMLKGTAFLAMTFIAPQAAYSDDRGWYVGLGAGRSDADISESHTYKELLPLGFPDASFYDETDPAWKIFTGFQFNRFFAMELGYIDFGEVGGVITRPIVPGFAVTTAMDIETKGFALSAIGNLPLGDKFDVFGRLGAFHWDIEAEWVIGFGGPPTPLASEDGDGTDAFYGIGAKYDFTENCGIRIEWERFDIDGADFDLISGSLVFRP